MSDDRRKLEVSDRTRVEIDEAVNKLERDMLRICEIAAIDLFDIRLRFVSGKKNVKNIRLKRISEYEIDYFSSSPPDDPTV